MKTATKREKRFLRHKRVRAKVYGTMARPRLYVFRSGKHLYGQLIDDEKGKTLVSAGDAEVKKNPPAGGKKEKDESREKETKDKMTIAFEVGKLIAEKAMQKKIEMIVFDRGGYKYHGRVKAFADGARAGGLKF